MGGTSAPLTTIERDVTALLSAAAATLKQLPICTHRQQQQQACSKQGTGEHKKEKQRRGK